MIRDLVSYDESVQGLLRMIRKGDEMEYITRNIEQDFMKASQTHKAVVVTGADQIGKTTMMKHLSEGRKRTYVSLGDLHPRTLADTDPDLFFEIFKPPIIIDEAHFVPSILHKIKELCLESDEMGQFWIACTPKIAYIKEVKKIMGKKAAVLNMYGLSLDERKRRAAADPEFSFKAITAREQSLGKIHFTDMSRYIWRGGLPQVSDLDQEDKAKYFWHYFHESLMHQVKQTKKVRLLTQFSDFLSACAVNICQVLSIRQVALAAGVSCPTATIWLQILVDLGIVYMLEPYQSKKVKRLVRKPKLYFTDTGFCSYISNWKTPKALMQGREADAYFENFVVMELVKKLANRGGVKLKFIRTSSGTDVNVVIIQAGKAHPFAIRKTAAPKQSILRKFEAIDSIADTRDGGIICTCKEVKRMDEKNYLLPCHLL